MREIKYIVLHCTATPQNTTVESIKKYWKEVMKWNSPGYHRIILPTGVVVELQDYSKPTNGVAGYNSNSIHISYIGGVDEKGKAVDNRTVQQKNSMYNLVIELKKKYPNAQVLGHRDFPNVKKDCPSFDVKTWLKSMSN